MLDKEIIEVMELFELMNESYPELVVVMTLFRISTTSCTWLFNKEIYKSSV